MSDFGPNSEVDLSLDIEIDDSDDTTSTSDDDAGEIGEIEGGGDQRLAAAETGQPQAYQHEPDPCIGVQPEDASDGVGGGLVVPDNLDVGRLDPANVNNW